MRPTLSALGKTISATEPEEIGRRFQYGKIAAIVLAVLIVLRSSRRRSSRRR